MKKVKFKTDSNNTKIINVYTLLQQWATTEFKKILVDTLESGKINTNKMLILIKEPNIKRFAEYLYINNIHNIKVSDKAIKELEQELNN